MRTTAALLSAAVVACTVVVALPAGAHDLPVGVHNVLDRIEPRVEGVTVQVTRTVADQMVAENRTEHDLEVLADTAEPFLRIGPQGVFANLNSPTWYLSSSVEGTVKIPERAKAGEPPDWAKLASTPSWGWFDHRLHPAAVPPPKSAKPQRLASWTVPLRYNGNPMTARGHLQFRFPRGSVVARITKPNLAPGIGAAVLPGRFPGVFLSVTSAAAVVVEGEHGEPFVRTNKTTTEVNEASPTWRFTAAARDVVPNGPVDPTAPPRWVALAGGGRVSWLEPRARYVPGEPSQRVQDQNRRVVVSHWRVPITVDGAPLEIDGIDEWVPTPVRSQPTTRPGSSRAAWYAAIGAGLASIAIATGLRRRRASSSPRRNRG